jgi:hypothetical protein
MSFDFDISTLPPEARRAGGEAQENSSAICAHHRPLVAAAAITNAVHYWSYGGGYHAQRAGYQREWTDRKSLADHR